MGQHGVVGRAFIALAAQPFLLLFLVVGLGYALGRLKVKGVGLGTTASTLIVGLAISLWETRAYGVTIAIPEFASTIFFNLFMFSIGMKVGPQFISGLRRDAGKFITLALLIPLLSLGCMFIVRALFTLPPGMGPGLFAGANTATPGLGAAQTAFASGAVTLPAGVRAQDALGNMSTAFAFAYCIGMVGFVLLLKLPDMLGRDTPAAARAFEATLRSAGAAPLPGSAEEFFGGPLPVAVRAYRVENPEATGRKLEELRRAYPRMAIERIRRGTKLLEPRDDVVLQLNDTLALYGPISGLINAGMKLGPEVDAPDVQQMAYETVDIVAHKPSFVNRTLRDVAASVGHGLYLNAMFRGGEQIPHGPDTTVHKGDVLRVTGSRWRIKILEDEVGKVIRPSVSTDIVTLAVGLTLGTLVGLIAIPIGGIKLSLGSAVGLLLVGIALSTLRTRHPGLGGPYPEPARQLIEDLGLNVFIAILGLNSGAGVLRALQAGSVPPIVVGALLVGLVPALIGWVVGRKLLKMNDALLLGAVAGGRCNSAGLRAAQEATLSTVPAISYPVTYAIANVVVTTMCYGMALLG